MEERKIKSGEEQSNTVRKPEMPWPRQTPDSGFTEKDSQIQRWAAT